MQFSQFVFSVLESLKRYLYIGVVTSQGAVVAQKVEYFSHSREHGETPTHGILPATGKRWRFPIDSHSVFWWEAPDEEDREAVDNYLMKRGFKRGLQHRKTTDEHIDTGDLQGEEENEYIHGHIKTPRRFKRK